MAELGSLAPAGGEYLFLIDQQNVLRFGISQTPTSQFFRRLITEAQGGSVWNWHDRVLLDDRTEARESLLDLHALFSGG